ncbi:MAG: hypothetical protein R3F43_23070 [bacterium]
MGPLRLGVGLAAESRKLLEKLAEVSVQWWWPSTAWKRRSPRAARRGSGDASSSNSSTSSRPTQTFVW